MSYISYIYIKFDEMLNTMSKTQLNKSNLKAEIYFNNYHCSILMPYNNQIKSQLAITFIPFIQSMCKNQIEEQLMVTNHIHMPKTELISYKTWKLSINNFLPLFKNRIKEDKIFFPFFKNRIKKRG